VRLIRQRKPKSVAELARIANRDFKAVYRDVEALRDLGLIQVADRRGGIQSTAQHYDSTAQHYDRDRPAHRGLILVEMLLRVAGERRRSRDRPREILNADHVVREPWAAIAAVELALTRCGQKASRPRIHKVEGRKLLEPIRLQRQRVDAGEVPFLECGS
jgi:predicted MarR family transcription regulator